MTDHPDTPLERLAEAVKLRDALNVGQVLVNVEDLRSLLSELTTLRVEKERLAEALKPFAEFGPWMAGSLNVQEAIHLGTRRDEFAKRLSVADFRRAASALEGEKT